MKEQQILIDEITNQTEKSVNKQVDKFIKTHKIDEDEREALNSMVLLHKLHPEIYDEKNLDNDLHTYINIKNIDISSKSSIQIIETKDYDKFELLDFNRDVKKVKNLEESMKRYGFLSPYPLHVIENGNGKLRIKAGHHRFHVARKLNLPVKYVLSNDDISIYDLEKATNPWVLKDYLDSYCRQGNVEYIKIKEYCEWSGINLSLAISMLAGETAGSTNNVDKFKLGIYKINQGSSHAYVVAKIALHLKGIGVSFYNVSNLIRAISKTIWVDELETTRLMEKFTSYKSLIEKKANIEQYLTMLEEIYNKGSHEKIPLKYLIEQKMAHRLPKQFRQRKI